MYKFLVILVCSSVVYTTNVYDRPAECAKGPEYWCQSFANAKSCSAYKMCHDTIWTKQKQYLDTELNLIEDQKCAPCLSCIRGDFSNCPQDFQLQLDEFSQFYMEGFPPRTICKLANGCNNEVVAPVENKQQQKCDLHPRHWCENLSTARKCQSLTQCRQNIWSKMPAQTLDAQYEDSETVCGFCIWSFNKLHEILQQNKTEFSIEDYLKGSCALLPISTLQDECVQTIEKNYIEIYSLLRDNTDPGIICRVLQVCKDEVLVEQKQPSPKKLIDIKVLDSGKTVLDTPLTRKSQHLLGSKTEVLIAEMMRSNGVGCELCSLVFDAARFMKKNGKSDDEVVAFMKEQKCSRLGSLRTDCEHYIDIKSFDILNDLVANNRESSQLCHDMGLCLKIQLTTATTRRFYDIHAGDTSNCTVCQTVMKTAKQMLDDKKSQDEILDYMRKELCSQSPKYEDMCKTVVTAYGPVILELFAQGLSPEQVCILLGFCSQPSQQQTAVSKLADQNCIMCEFVMQTLAKYITKNSSAAQIEKALEYVCHILPKTVRDECNQFVVAYEPIIAQLLAGKIDPKQVCTEMGLCKAAVVPPKDPKPECVMCEFVMNALDQVLAKDSTEQEIKQFLDKVCTRLPASVQDNCKQFVDAYEPLIISFLTGKQTADELCQAIHFCLAELSVHGAKTALGQPMTKAEFYCEACEFTLKFIQYEIGKDRSGQTINRTLENVCKIAPAHLEAKCESIVATYGVFLINLLDKYVDASIVCQQIGLCTAAAAVQQEEVKPVDIQPAVVVKKPSDIDIVGQNVPQDSLECNMCVYVAEVVDSLLKQNKTEVEIIAEFKKLCIFFKGAIKDQCNAFIDQYGVYVIQMLASDLDPQDICKSLNLCPAKYYGNSFRRLVKSYRNMQN